MVKVTEASTISGVGVALSVDPEGVENVTESALAFPDKPNTNKLTATKIAASPCGFPKKRLT